MSDEGEESPVRPRRKIKRVMVVSSASSSESDDGGPTTSTRRRRMRVLSDEGSDTSSGSSVVCGVRRRRGALPQLRDSDGDSDTSGWATDHSDAPKPEPSQVAPKPSSGFASDSSEGNSDKCSICLMRFTEQQVGTPATCEHIFCLDCIKEWSKNVNTCPVDRISFESIVVRTCVGGRVLRNEPVKVVERPSSVDMMFVEDPTVCEICGSSSSEETMLLCDGCDLGYHMECLTPPLTEVPVDQWLCPNCDGLFDVIHLSEVNDLFSEIGDVDLDSLGPRASALRAERTVRRSQRRQPPADQPSTSSGRRGSATDRLTGSRTTTRRRQPATTHRTHCRKHKRRRTKTVIIEYEVQENGKFAVTKTIKRRVKKRKTRTRRVRTAARRTQVRASVRAQLASLRAGGAGLAHSRPLDLGAGSGLPALSLFGSRDQLEYFSDEEQSTAGTGSTSGAGVAVATRPTPAIFSAYRQARRKMLRVPSPSPASVAPDLVSSILESQTLLHSRRAVASVAPDGALHIELRPSPAARSSSSDRVDVTRGADEGTRQVPAYPGGGRGGGGGWGGGYRGTYHREQTANSYARGGYGGYPPARQPPPLYRRNGGRPDDFEGGGYPPPRRGPPFLPEDAPYERRRSDAGRGRAPWAPRAPGPARHSFGGFESAPGPAPSYPPLREPPTFHFEKPSEVEDDGGGGGNKSEDERSDPDLVIDTEKYDPTEPTNDDDDPPPPAPPPIVDTSYASPEASCDDPSDSVEPVPLELSLPLPPTPAPPTASILDSAVRAVLEEHRLLAGPGPADRPTARRDPSDDDDAEEDGDCPNFSIYSATSVHIASTAASQEEPRDLQSERVSRRCPITVSPRNPIKIKLNAPTLIKRHVSLYDDEDGLPDDLDAPLAPSPLGENKTLVAVEESQGAATESPQLGDEATPSPPPEPVAPGGRDDDHDDDKREGGDDENEREQEEDEDEGAGEGKAKARSLSRSPSVGSSPSPSPPSHALEKMTESISEETEDERSYTPCLDENTGLEGLDTELISEDEAPGFEDERGDPDPDPDHVPALGADPDPDPDPVVTPPRDTTLGADDDDTQPTKKKKKKERGIRGERKPKRELTFKKIGKSGKERTYRERDKKRDRRESSESRVSRRRRDKRKDLERYDVRTVVGDKRRRVKDAFGRDVSPPAAPPPPRSSASPRRPSISPRRRKSVSPRRRLSISPRRRPSISPRRRPSASPRRRPSVSPRRRPSVSPRRRPSVSPRRRPSMSPRRRPSVSPRRRPSVSPRRRPSVSPRRRPSASPRKRPSASPRRRPSVSPRRRPSMSPRRRPSMSPRRRPSMSPRRRLSMSPRRRPSISPRRRPSISPRRRPSMSPRRRLSMSPRRRPSISPRRRLSISPQRRPSMSPRRRPSMSPRRRPSVSPRKRASMSPRRRMSMSPRRRVSGSPAGSPAHRSPSPRRRRRPADGAPSRPKRRRLSGTRSRKRRRSASPEPSPKPKAKKKKRARSEQRRRSPRRRRRAPSGAVSPPAPGWPERPPSPRTPPAAPPPPPPRRLDRVKHRRARDSAGPSKEVFTSGDNILVSVSFKDQEESAARRERRRERRRRRRAAVETELAAVKPVAIIDLARSPFRELTPSPKNVIVLSDDEGRDAPPAGVHTAPPAPSPQGPKTPPSPRAPPDPAPAPLVPSPAPVAGAPGRGPNTPPSPPDSPDAYDPYEPTRSRSGSRSPRRDPSPPAPPLVPSDRPAMTLEAAQKTNLSADEVLDRRPLEPMEKVLALLASTRDVSPDPPPVSRGSDPSLGQPPPLESAPGPPPPQPPKLFLAKPSPIKSDPIKPMQQATKISRLPLPLPVMPLAEADSPYSPGSSDFGELFEPPAPAPAPPAAPAPALAPRDAFDALFDKPRNRKRPSAKVTPKPKPSKKGKAVVDVRLDDDSLKVLEELPSSAVEMQVKTKFLKKLNRQERVVEEVKLVLKPHYNKKHVTKEEYKHILRRAVPKICHNKTGEINPTKIQALVEAYVNKFRKKRKLGLP